MTLLNRTDADRICGRFRAWWNNELDDFMLVVKAPKATGEPPVPPPADPVERFTNLEYLDRLNDHALRNTFLGGDALPIWAPGNASWSYLAALLGVPIKFGPDTVWEEPLLEKGELRDHDFRQIVVKEDNHWWQLTQKVQQHAAEVSRGKAVPALTNYRASGDVVAAFRSTMALLLDLVEDPEYVRAFDAHVVEEWIRVNDRLIDIRLAGGQGYAIDWMSVWSDKRMHPVQNDFACMISTKMFEEIFLDNLIRQINCLEHVLYHVDGPGAFRHVDVLLEIDRIRAFQIHPGAGNPGPLHYLEVLQRVQRKNRGLHITIGPEEVPRALELLKHKGLFIQTFCGSVAEAEEVLRKAGRPVPA